MPWLDGFDAVIRALDARPDGVVSIDDPITGVIEGPDALARYREAGRGWRATPVVERRIGLAVSPNRAVGEFEVDVRRGERTATVPVAIVVDRSRERPTARIYLSAWSVTGEHIARGPRLPAAPSSAPSGVVGAYVRALAAGDVDACVGCYEPDGRLQGGGGPDHATGGHDALRAAYGDHLAAGGIVLEPCSLTVDGPRIALEFVVRSWGGVAVDQAGLSVYTLGPSGRILWNRVYDDAANPAVARGGASD